MGVLRLWPVVVAVGLLLSSPSLAQAASTPGSYARLAASGSATAPSARSEPSAQGKLVDINTASAAELDALPGVGKKRAEAIIAHRPYKSKDELVSKRVVPQKVYDDIKDKIVARRKS